MKKLTIEFSREMTNKLEQMASRETRLPVEVIKRSLALYDQVTKKGLGGYVNIEYPDGTMQKVYVK